MKTRHLLLGLLLLLMGGCAHLNYLPSPEKTGINEYGSYIRVTLKSNSIVRGELIALDSTTLVLLTKKKKLLTIPVNVVKQFKLRYARPKSYGWTIPVFGYLSGVHGLYAAISLPVNLIVTISVTASGNKAYSYSHKTIGWDKLKMFARFPQGIPPQVNPSQLR